MSCPAASWASAGQARSPPEAFAAGRLTTAAPTSNVAVTFAGQVYGPDSAAPQRTSGGVTPWSGGFTPTVLRREEAVVEVAHHLLEGRGRPRLVALPPLQDGLATVEEEPGGAGPARVHREDAREASRAHAIERAAEGFPDRSPVRRREAGGGLLEARPEGGEEGRIGRAGLRGESGRLGLLDAGGEAGQRERIPGGVRATAATGRGSATAGRAPVQTRVGGAGE